MISATILLEAYARMLTIRYAEEQITKDFLERKIFSFYHSSVGQEAAAVGVCAALSKEDRVFGNHRSHGHYLAKGGDLYKMFCEIYGKEDGCCRGKGGSMHMLDRSVGFMGSTPILGSAVPIAAGSAFEQKASNSKNITVVFTGDGASEEGVVYETINFAAVKKLPLIVVIEDNLYAVNTPKQERRSPLYSMLSVCSGLGVDYWETWGNSFLYTYSTALDAVHSARNGRPVVLTVSTHRHMAHSGPIKDESVRQYDTEPTRQAEDCIKKLENDIYMQILGTDAEVFNHIRSNVHDSVMAAWQRAQECPQPSPENAKLGVYV